jgi:GTPase
VPDRPAKLLPGLEESQGALYEIGVADDGTLVGLVEDELQESLINLNAMAASLGCTTSVLRKVAVGTCEWADTDGGPGDTPTRKDRLWVAEVLVYPDSRGATDADIPKAALYETVNPSRPAENSYLAEHASTEQIRVTLVGATAAGKSTLLGTLSTSTLDNGRGRSRLSLLKHRHEIASGITSSVAHELVGYIHGDSTNSVNYASGNISSWLDIHNVADRLVFLSDSPGLPRFAKSALRSLISWRPAWTILCIAADHVNETTDLGTKLPTAELHADGGTGENVDLSLSYLNLCLRLHVSFMVVITKLDLANKAGLRLVLAKVLSAIKAAGRKPAMLSNTPVPASAPEYGAAASELQIRNGRDEAEVDRLIASMQDDAGQAFVPILMTSAVTGLGISKLHALLRTLPVGSNPVPGRPLLSESPAGSALFHVDEVFSIPPSRVYTLDTATRIANRGIVLCGYVSEGLLSVGDTMLLGPFMVDADASSTHTPQPVLRASSYSAHQAYSEALPGSRARSYQGEPPREPTPRLQPSAVFVRVRIVSLRTLRLPVIHMQYGETGTIGVEPLDNNRDTIPLGRARKGMVLVNVTQNVTGYHAFSATFPASDFERLNSPVLILGGHAIVYVNSVRAAVKVTAVALDEDEQQPGTVEPATASSQVGEEADLFLFDGDDDAEMGNGDRPSAGRQEIKLTFRFGSTVEWMKVGDQVLVVPTVTAAGPVTGPTTSAVNLSGLAGYVGRICELSA